MTAIQLTETMVHTIVAAKQTETLNPMIAGGYIVITVTMTVMQITEILKTEELSVPILVLTEPVEPSKVLLAEETAMYTPVPRLGNLRIQMAEVGAVMKVLVNLRQLQSQGLKEVLLPTTLKAAEDLSARQTMAIRAMRDEEVMRRLCVRNVVARNHVAIPKIASALHRVVRVEMKDRLAEADVAQDKH